jgi:hypothetical protein
VPFFESELLPPEQAPQIKHSIAANNNFFILLSFINGKYCQKLTTEVTEQILFSAT